MKQQPDYQLIVFSRGKNSLARWWYPTPEKWASPSDWVSAETVRTFLLHRSRALWLSWYGFFFVDCLICSKGGGILYQLALQLWILYFRVTVHWTAFNSTFQPSSTLSVYGEISAIAFHTVYKQNLLKRITIKISNNITKQLTHSSCLYWSQGPQNSIRELGPIDMKSLKRHGCKLHWFVHLKSGIKVNLKLKTILICFVVGLEIWICICLLI